jgi:transcriptional regulator with GAF, ATPase, and Fis domain
MSNRRGRSADLENGWRWCDAISSLRSRLGVEDAATLLEESLALLDSIARLLPPPGRRPQLPTGPGDAFPEIDGRSPEMRRLKEQMCRVAQDGDVTVLILGESGTGKELVARAIHRGSPRSRYSFEVVNCAGLAPTLAEDELFGHVRGAFTGAVDAQPGPFERANGGTVFLDEIGDLSIDLQMKLLRALQQRAVQRLGSRHETSFDVRVIAATNVDLARAVNQGRFRADLYYRLKVYVLGVPPVRRRGAADLRILIDAILERLAERRRRSPPAVDPEVIRRLVRWAWPGNVRELENTLESMIVSAGADSVLKPQHLPDGFDTPCAASMGQRTTPISSADISAALRATGSRTGAAAAQLGLSRHQLYRLTKRHGIVPLGTQD